MVIPKYHDLPNLVDTWGDAMGSKDMFFCSKVFNGCKLIIYLVNESLMEGDLPMENRLHLERSYVCLIRALIVWLDKME